MSRWLAGDRVTVPFVEGCGRCAWCPSGNAQVCPDQQQPGFTHWGSFAEYVGLHAADTNLVAIPVDVTAEAAASLGCRFATAGLHQTFASKGGGANEFRPGYIAVILADAAKLEPASLWVKDDRLHFSDSADALRPLTGFAYMLFRIEKRADRDDWEGLTSIREPYDSALDALEQQDQQRAETFIRTAIVKALQSSDLTQADRIRVVRTLKEEYDRAKDLGLGAIRVDRQTLSTAMARSISSDEALALGEPTYDDLFS